VRARSLGGSFNKRGDSVKYKVMLYESGNKGASLRSTAEFASRRLAAIYVNGLPKKRATYRNRADRYYTVTVAGR
jgi:hypothetical protein